MVGERERGKERERKVPVIARGAVVVAVGFAQGPAGSAGHHRGAVGTGARVR